MFESNNSQSITEATDWITTLLTGSLAIALCVLAVAFVGLLMLAGRLSVRTALRVVLGCFVLLGAPVIAAAFMFVPEQQPPPVPEVIEVLEEARPNLPPSDYDPYAGASLRVPSD